MSCRCLFLVVTDNIVCFSPRSNYGEQLLIFGQILRTQIRFAEQFTLWASVNSEQCLAVLLCFCYEFMKTGQQMSLSCMQMPFCFSIYPNYYHPVLLNSTM